MISAIWHVHTSCTGKWNKFDSFTITY